MSASGQLPGRLRAVSRDRCQAGFLAGYGGLTRDAYILDLRQYTAWCQQLGLHLFQAGRADLECLGRDMDARGRARASIARRLCTVAGFYRHAVEEELSITHPRYMSVARDWTTSRTPSDWTATKSARCWSPPGQAAPTSMP